MRCAIRFLLGQTRKSLFDTLSIVHRMSVFANNATLNDWKAYRAAVIDEAGLPINSAFDGTAQSTASNASNAGIQSA